MQPQKNQAQVEAAGLSKDFKDDIYSHMSGEDNEEQVVQEAPPAQEAELEYHGAAASQISLNSFLFAFP